MELADIEHFKIDVKCCDSSSTFIFEWIFFNLQVKRITIKTWISLKFCQICLQTVEFASLEFLENLHRLTIGEMLPSKGSEVFLAINIFHRRPYRRPLRNNNTSQWGSVPVFSKETYSHL